MMHRLRTAAAIIFSLVILVVLTLRIVGFPPKDRRPGLWLPGEVVTTPVSDWSFSDASPQIQIQTQSWYLLPHSVTIACATLDGHLYIATAVPPGSVPPGGRPQRRWNRNIDANPHIRAKIGDKLYDLRATLITDSAETERIFGAYVKKYPSWQRYVEPPPSDRMQIFYWRTDPV